MPTREAALLRRLAFSFTSLALLLAACLAALAAARFRGMAFAIPFERAGVPALPLAALLVALGPVLATRRVLAAREGCGPAGKTRGESPGAASRLPALRLVLPPGLLGAALAAWGLPATVAPGATPAALAVATIVGAFPLLLIERTLAAIPAARLPEAPDLRRIVLLAVLATVATGLAGAASAALLPGGAILLRATGLIVAVAGLELACRAIGRCFLPPGPAEAARAVAGSLVARIAASLLHLDGNPAELATAVLRDQLGLDISRSWALRYLRGAALPLGGALALALWGMSALAIVPVDARAVYFRFGKPVSVLHPGLHATLPWPFGATRAVEWGAVHEASLGGDAGGVPAPPPMVMRARAEDPAPVEADRLWNQPHPGELTLLVASRAAAGTGQASQLFQSVSADLRVFYRVGLTDRAAIEAVTAATDPGRLLRADAGLVVARLFAGSTLAAVLGGDRAAMAATLQARLAALLAAQHLGLEPVAVSIEAIHPPAGAAEAYHAVRAAQILADATIYAERGRAFTIRAQTQQYAFTQTAAAAGLAAETTGAAQATRIRFGADADIAASPDGPAFLLERRLAVLQSSLARRPLTLVDSRLASGATTIDLRPPGPATPTTGDGE